MEELEELEGKHVFVPIVPEVKTEAEKKAFPRPSSGEQPSPQPRGGIAHWIFHLAWEGAPKPHADGREGKNTPEFVRQVSASTQERCRTESNTAYNCVKAINLKPSWLRTPYQHHLSDREARQRWIDAVEVALIPTDVKGWEGSSTTLGLALGLLMAGTDCRVGKVVATGDLLETRADGGIGVKEIGSLARKLDLVEAWGKAEKTKAEEAGGTGGPPVPFFIPLQNLDPIPKKLTRGEFTKLYFGGEQSWGKALEAVGVKLIGVDTLQEAARHLGVHRLRANARDHWCNVIRALVAAVVVTGSAYGLWELWIQRWRDQPIAGGISFAPVLDDKGRQRETPYRTTDYEGKKAHSLCANNGLVAGEYLHLLTRLGDGSTSDAYWPAAVAVNTDPSHPPKVYGPHDDCVTDKVPSGANWACAIETRAGEFKDMAVVVVADRVRDISSDLTREVAEITPRLVEETAKGRAVNLRGVINHFNAAYPGRVTSRVVSLLKPEECEPK